ncbi:hypothetical protein F53441_7259, partial [Fusarium austroafricanum]
PSNPADAGPSKAHESTSHDTTIKSNNERDLNGKPTEKQLEKQLSRKKWYDGFIEIFNMPDEEYRAKFPNCGKFVPGVPADVAHKFLMEEFGMDEDVDEDVDQD